MSNKEQTYQLVILGRGGVGKSSLCLKYTTNEFPDLHMETPWVDTYDKHIDIGKRKRRRIHLRIFDTAGQEEMVALWEQHLKDKDTVLLVLSLSDEDSVTRAAEAYSGIENHLRRHYREKAEKAGRDPEKIPDTMPILLACNKCDLEKTNPEMVKFSRSEIISRVGVHESQVIYTSAKEGIRVQEAFKQAVELIPGALPSSGGSDCSIS